MTLAFFFVNLCDLVTLWQENISHKATKTLSYTKREFNQCP